MKFDLQSQVLMGEDSRRQFKEDVRNADSLAAEMVAFANSNGGQVFIGVADDGSIPGLTLKDVARVNQLISNVASQSVRSPLAVQTENVALENKRIVIVLTVPKGIDKPYFDKNGVIWLKAGADKRRVNSKEELRRFFQFSDQFHADELPTRAGVDQLDRLRFRDFLRDVYDQEMPEDQSSLVKLLSNMNLASESGQLNLASALLFAEQPELIKPQFVVKAVCYPGNSVAEASYVDSEEFAGPLSRIFSDAQAFVMRNLHKVQAGRSVNAPGTPEIPGFVFEELLVNALVHRDYLVNAPIRLFVFEDRIEIISPGHLPNNLTVDKIRTGNSNIRNPVLVSYASKGLLPYHGIGSGIRRALAGWPDIQFSDDHDGCVFTANVRRKPLYDHGLPESGRSLDGCIVAERSVTKGVYYPNGGEIQSSRPELTARKRDILARIERDSRISRRKLADELGINPSAVSKHLESLKQAGYLRRIGGTRGYWDVL